MAVGAKFGNVRKCVCWRQCIEHGKDREGEILGERRRNSIFKSCTEQCLLNFS